MSKDKYKSQKRRWLKRKIDAIDYMGGKCADCGGTFHYSQYEFHHLDPSTKEYNWSKMRLRTLSSMRAELDKCVMLCANCHRFRHWGDRGLEEDIKPIIKFICPVCGADRKSRNVTCSHECDRLRRFSHIPSKEILIVDLKSTNFSKTAKKYGVSCNAVRKWCIKYGISNKSKDYKS